MHLHSFTIERIALELSDKGSKNNIVEDNLVEAFSTDKDALILRFKSLTIKITFYKGEALFQFPDESKLQKKNRLSCFKELTVGDCKVKQVIAYPFDRLFQVEFTKGYSLYFLLFGRFSQIGLYKDGALVSHFPSKSKEIDVANFNVLAAKDVCNSIDKAEQLSNQLRFLTNHQIVALEKDHFLESSKEHQTQLLHNLRDQYLRSRLFITKGEKSYKLCYTASNQDIASFESVLEALDNFSRLYISHKVFLETKLGHLGVLHKELKTLVTKKKSLNKKLSSLSNASTYKQKADLLMAYLHLVPTNSSTVELNNFEGTERVTIALNKMLSPQANAEKFYRKSKNESKQIAFVLKNLASLEAEITKREEEIEAFNQLESFKEILKTSQSKPTKIEVRLPYRKLMMDGYEVRIGRGAKDNDELLRMYTSKNDIWLHAKSVSGSHVIIRNPSKKEVSLATIEKVAQLAAFYSKAKTESLAAVMYTERKFVRKPKGATPGLVKVDKEQTILVEPKNF